MTKLLSTDRIFATRPGDPTAILDRLDTPDDTDRTYVRAMKTWCAAAGIDPFIALTQWAVETANGTSARWLHDHNPGGVGISADSTVQPFEIANGDEAARIHVQALYSAVTRQLHPDVPVPVAAQPWFDGVWLPKVTHPNYPGVTTVDDLNTRYTANGDAHATWAWDAEYVSTLISRCALFYPDLQSQGGTSLELKPYAIAGTDRQIWSPVPIEINLVPASHTNQRPGYALRDPHRVVQHETGNDGAGADADMHHTWLYNGADGSKLSFHFVTDDHKIIQLVPVDEVTWQAADDTGPGNFNGVSNEGCVNSDGDMSLMRRNSEYLMGGIAAIFDMPDDYMERHYDFNWADPDRHYCPYYMMIQGYWPTFQANANAIKRRYADGSISGEVIPVPTPYTKPQTWPWMNPADPGFGKDHTVGGTRFFFIPQTYVVTAETGRQAWATKDSPPAGPNIEVGTRFGGHYVFRSNDDQQTYTMTKVNASGTGGNRILSKKLLPKVQITKSGTVTVREMPNSDPVIVRKQGKPVGPAAVEAAQAA